MNEQSERQEQKGVNINRKQRINVTFHPTTLAQLEEKIPGKQRSAYIENLIRADLGLPVLDHRR